MNPLGNLMAPPTRLPEDPATARLAAGDPPAQVAAAYPASSAAWATLAEAALAEAADTDTAAADTASGDGTGLASIVRAYAYARTGYHRGLDALRRAGWKGQGPVPWAHEPNRGFLRALHALATAAAAIEEQDEATRCAQFLTDCDPEAVRHLTA